MENNNPKKRIHPLVAGAAISVILVSLTGVAAITGLLPTSHGTNAPAPDVPAANSLAAPTTTPTAATATKPEEVAEDAPQQRHGAPHSTQTTQHHASERVAQAPICSSCGRVESVQAIQHEAKPSGVGVVAGAVLGGVLGNQVGGGKGRTLATVAGAVGGGYAGNEVEKRSRSTTSYQVRVRMEDGSIRTFPYAQQPGWNAGDRVRVVNGHLTERA